MKSMTDSPVVVSNSALPLSPIHIISSIVAANLHRLTSRWVKDVVDTVSTNTGNHKVFAIANNDLVDTTQAGSRRVMRSTRAYQDRRGIEVNLAVVTKHHIAEVTNTSMNHIATGTTEHNVGALVNEDEDRRHRLQERLFR